MATHTRPRTARARKSGSAENVCQNERSRPRPGPCEVSREEALGPAGRAPALLSAGGPVPLHDQGSVHPELFVRGSLVRDLACPVAPGTEVLILGALSGG